MSKAGYHSVIREYDDLGHIKRIEYRNTEGMPTVISSGYAIESRVCSDEGLILSVRYFDADGKPTLTLSDGYGKDNSYDENGKNTKITYVDEKGRPLKTRREYATVTRTYYESEGYENGKIKDEYYYDENDNPVALSNGAYGTHREYNDDDETTVLTYLDKSGNPIITNQGYTTVIRSKYASNTEYTERYYDINGKPFALSEGQYGIKRYNGQTVYLNSEGNEIFNIKNYLHNHSRIVVLLTLIVIVISTVAGKNENIFLLVAYTVIIIYLTLMFRESNESKSITNILWSYKQFIYEAGARSEIIKNIWLFIPLGTILYRLYPKKIIVLVPVAFSALIEGIQLLTDTGFCELDDIISNSLGGFIGFYAGKLTTEIKQRINQRKQIYSA